MGETTGLEGMICFELYAASRAMTALYRPALDAEDLTYPQFLALRVINDRGTLTVGELGRVLGLDSGTLSPLLRRLDQRGLTLRGRGESDQRKVWTQLSPKGQLLHDRLADLPTRLGCALDLTTEEFTTLSTLLGKLRSSATTSTIS
ncbi:MarR family winged helix-turn-helix transcriptional regulator [Actinoplanes sp. RD1]|uniref:MarR family winged helix-turn-helix transcriptional regulator n=1 Tax=Actinoplanes sp. RD1 TaxID=3064538 RepID=UPI0027418E64|nr:MarR family transcriptional regulator [Actinoplanes sp. RD1]